MRKMMLLSGLMMSFSLFAVGEGAEAGAEAAIELGKPKEKPHERIFSSVKDAVLDFGMDLDGSNSANSPGTAH